MASNMEIRKLGSDLHVAVLSFGTATFGDGPAFKAWGGNGVKEDALDAVAKETGKAVAQIAINWVLQRPSAATVIIGARDESGIHSRRRKD
jgi:aryl-alcohol dehydrogenase-like predicted oxidoreductase